MPHAWAWAVAFAVATLVSLLVTPCSRAVALRLRQSARERSRDSRRRRAPLTTALGPPVAVAATLPLVGWPGHTLLAGLVAASGLWIVGLLVDRGRVGRRASITATLAVSVALASLGLRLRLTGVLATDLVVTTLVLTATARSLQRFEARPGLAPASGAVIGGSAALIGGLAGQRPVAVLGAALAGGCLGFLPFTLAPATAKLRSGGGLFVGFVAAVLALDAKPSIATPGAALVGLLLLAVPLADAALVWVTRRRRGRIDAAVAGLAGRLRARGLGSSSTKLLLLAVEVVLAAGAVLEGRGVLRPAWTAGLAVVSVAGLVGATARSPIHAPPGRLSPRARRVLGGAAVALVVAAAPAVLALVVSRGPATAATTAAEHALTAARRGDSRASAVWFARARDRFERARGRLAGPLVSLGLSIPGLGPNVRAARDLAAVGTRLARIGTRLTTSADPDRLRIVRGTVPVAELRRLEPQLAAAADELERARGHVRRIDRSFLVPTVNHAIAKLDRRIDAATHDARLAALSAHLLPAILGGDGPRRYFLAVQNNAEARATGGFIGNWGEISASGGHLELDRFARIDVLNPPDAGARPLRAPAEYVNRYGRFEPASTWQNVNMTPDFPTVGAVIHELFPQSGGAAIDGVVSIDPPGLAAILRLTGPIVVAGWPTPISARNVVDITLRQAYVRFAGDSTRRAEFLGDVAHAAWNAFTRADLGKPSRVLRTLSDAVREKHLTVWLAQPKEQRLVAQAGVAAAVPRGDSDVALATTQNAGANKIDVYLRRRIRYRLRLDPTHDARAATARGLLDVSLENTAPAAGLPRYVIGPSDPRFLAGENRTFLSVYSPLSFETARLDGTPTRLESGTELGRHVYSAFVSVPAQSTRTLELDVRGTLALDAGGWYRLDLVRQPLLDSDRVEVVVDLAPGWRFVDGQGLRIVADGRRARVTLRLDRDRRLRVRVERATNSDLWDRVRRGG